MRRGKEIAQGSHASMEFLATQIRRCVDQEARLFIELSPDETRWLLHGMAKVCLRVNSEQELLHYHQRAQDQGLKSFLIKDSGRTEFAGKPTLTACAIGPDQAPRIDAVTGDLTRVVIGYGLRIL